MSLIIVKTEIKAPKERCFELSTSIDLHKISASKSKEQAIAGTTEGLIKLHDTVTWKAKHFGMWHKMTVKITDFENPNYFVDEMVKGIFKYMKHKHEFIEQDGYTIMTDRFNFSSPIGIIGKLVDKFVLKRYMTNFLIERNSVIKDFAETDKWKQVLQIKNER